jgi:hypothetical protein
LSRHAAFAALLAIACSYDFDRYAAPSEDPGAEGGEGGELAGAGTGAKGGAAGKAGASGSGGASAGKGGSGAGGDAGSGGSTSDAEGGTTNGDSGRGGEGGELAAGNSGTAGSAGTSGSAGTGGGGPFDCAARSGTTFDGRCYFVVGSTGLPFDEALAACAANDGATLVAITSAEEQSAIEAAFFPAATDLWIGLSLEGAPDDVPIECSILPETCPFEWTSGEDLAFTDWALRDGDDEPNYTGACVRIQAADLAWADYGCTSPLPAICER